MLHNWCVKNQFCFCSVPVCFVVFFSFCFVLFCFVLFCFVLFCFVLSCLVLFCFVPIANFIDGITIPLVKWNIIARENGGSYDCEWMNIALRRIAMAIYRQNLQKKARNRDSCSFRMTSRVIYSAYHHCICTTSMTNIRPDQDSNSQYILLLKQCWIEWAIGAGSSIHANWWGVCLHSYLYSNSLISW